MTAALDWETKFWNRIARKYAADPVGDPHGYEKTLRRTGELLARGDRVLELGCGTGTTALRLAPLVAHYAATDLSPAMIDIANDKLAADPCSNLEFATATAETVARPEPGYDAVLGFNYLHLVPDLNAALAAIHALLRPGGIFVSKTPCLGDMNPLLRWLVLPALRLIGKAPAVNCFSLAEFRDAICKAGLAIECTEWHATKGKDARPFIVARKV